MTRRKRAWIEPNPKHPRGARGRFVKRGTGLAGKAVDAVKKAKTAPAKVAGPNTLPKKTAGNGNAAFLAKFSAKVEKQPAIKLGALATLPTKKAPKPAEPAKPVNPKTGRTITPLKSDGPYRNLTPEEADALHERMTDGRPWSAGQVDALVAYTDEDYAPINTALRKGKGGSAGIQAKTATLRSAMREIPEDIVISRALDASAFGYGEDDYEIPRADVDSFVGRTFHEPGFLSSSIDRRSADYVELRISVPAGTRGAYLNSISEYPQEREMLLDRGTHMKITKVERRGEKTIMHVTVVGQDD